MASHFAAQSPSNPPVVVAASSRPGLLLCATARVNGEASPLSSCTKSARLEDSECKCSRCANSSHRHHHDHRHHHPSGQRLQPPPRDRPIRACNHPSPTGTSTVRHRSSEPSSHSPSRSKFRPKIKSQTDNSATFNPVPNSNSTFSAARGRSPTAAMPSTLAPTQSAPGHPHSQYLSPHGASYHQYSPNFGKSPHPFKSYRNSGHSMPSVLHHSSHASVSPQPPVPLQPPEQQHQQSNMWQTHLLTEPSPLLASMPALPLPLTATPSLTSSPYGTEMGHLGTATIIATNGFGGASGGSVGSSGSATPLNGQQHHHHQALVGHPFHQQHHQQHHHLFHPSPTAITAALNQTPTPILNSEDTYICCAYTPRCFIIQKVRPSPASSTPGTGTCSSLQSPQSEHSQSLPVAASPPSTVSSCSGSSSAEVVSVLELSIQQQPPPKPSSTQCKSSGPSPPLLITPPKLSLNDAEPVGTGISSSFATSNGNSTTSTISDRPPLISASVSSKTSNHERTANLLSIDENESGGTGHSADPLGRLVRRPEDESFFAAAATGNCNNNLDLCHQVKCHRGASDSAPSSQPEQPQTSKNRSSKTTLKKKNDRSKVKSKATSSPLSSPEKSAADQRTRPTTRSGKGSEETTISGRQHKPLANGLLPLHSNQSADRSKQSGLPNRKSRTDSSCDSLKLDKLFLPAFALAAVTSSQHIKKPTSSTGSESSSGHTSTPPSTASSSPNSVSSTTDLATKRPGTTTNRATAVQSTAELKQRNGPEVEKKKKHDRCNVLGKSGGSRCDKDYDDDDDSLLVVVKQEEQTTRSNQTKAATVSDDASAVGKPHTTGDDLLTTESKNSLDSGTVPKDQTSTQMETDIMESTGYSADPSSSLCLNATVLPLDINHYDAGINCQMVAMNHDGQLIPESMMSDLNINADNVSVNGDMDGGHLLQEDARSITPTPANMQGLPLKELLAALRRQLEYYFSRENLAKDSYLLSQMDKDQYVSIDVVANFNEIKRLTNDFNMVVDALRSSSEVHVDESGLKVRPNSKRCVVILRDVPKEVEEEHIKKMFEMEKCPVPLVKCEFAHNSSWYLFFTNDDDAQSAIHYLKETLVNYPDTNIPILARIKAKPIVQYRNKALVPTPNVIRPIGIVTAPSPVGSTVSNQSAAVSPVSSLSGSVNNPTVLMPNVTPPSSVINEAGTIGVAPYSTANVYSAYPPNVPILANNSRVYTNTQFYAPQMIQMPSSTSPCYDLSTVFVANGLAPHTYSSGVVTSLTAGVPQTCLSVAPAGSTHPQQPPLQFIATSGAGGPALIANPGNGAGSGNGGGRYGGSNSNYGNSYPHYPHHYNTYPKSHGGGGGHHRMGGGVPVNSNSANQSSKPYRGNKYANSGYISGQHYQQQQQQHSNYPVYHNPPSSVVYHPNSYASNPVATNVVHSAVVSTEPPVSSGFIGHSSSNNSHPSASPSVVCPPPPLATASSASTSTTTSSSSTSAISNCVTTASSKESATTGQSQKPTSHLTLHFGKQQSSIANHATSHIHNQSVAPPQSQHHSGSSQPNYSSKSSYHSNSSQTAHKSSVEPAASEPPSTTKSVLAGKLSSATVANSSNGPDVERSSHSNHYSSRSSNQSSSVRSSGPRTFEREPREPREPRDRERDSREPRQPKSGSGTGGYRGKREYSNNYPPSSTPGPVSEIDGNIIRKSERSGSGKFSRSGAPSSGPNSSKASTQERDRTGSGSFSTSSRPARNPAASNSANTAATAEQPFNLMANSFPPLPGLDESPSGESKDVSAEMNVVPNHSSDAQNGSQVASAVHVGKSHESSLADVVKGHATAAVSIQLNTSEDRNANYSDNSSHHQSSKTSKNSIPTLAAAPVTVNHVEPIKPVVASTSNKGSISSITSSAESAAIVVNHKPVQLEVEHNVSSSVEPIASSSSSTITATTTITTNELQSATPTLAAMQSVSNNITSSVTTCDLVKHDSSASTTSSNSINHDNHIGPRASTSRSSSVSFNRNDSSLGDFPLDGLPSAPVVDTSGQAQSSVFTYAQIARQKASKLAASQAAAANHDISTGSLATSTSEHSIANSVVVGASLVNHHHIHKDPHSAASNASLRTRSIVK